jgi:hypothetical protein
MKKWRRFVNTVAPWAVPVRQSLHILQRCGAFIAAFTNEIRWMTIKKKFIPQLAIDTKFFHRAIANP